ncbi:AfsR/SARP family transcriptional regulator [Plantactinospora sonchi]|uniref:BTAD domain-containing putative transcriptional regulator n=1 Tax=Plantactinospora sonchi TaxID=1544735 RepID=A0ABU7RYR0_9ACTN
MVEFRLLGEVEARVDGHPVDLGHARQRAVLAALLVEANGTVPVDRLLDRVWGDRQPQRAREALYSYLSRLRRRLAGAGTVTISRQAGGYLVTVSPSAVDLHRFRHLVGQARTADDGQALALLEEALGLWHGPAFAGLDTPWLNTTREALGQELLTAERRHADLALAAGRHTEILTRLLRLAAEHPLDEHLAGQLMLALYRCGRQADALARYQRLRELLADELGADPGTALRELHRRILTADPALDVPAVEPAAVRAPVPRQLPASPPLFVGRAEELAALAEPADAPVWIVCGTGGVGKTWLVLRWAHDNLWRFPDGQIWLNLRGFAPAATPVSPSTAVRAILDALGVPATEVPTDLDAQIGLYRSLVAGRRMLIVLDNAVDAAQVRPLLPGGDGCVVLVTSRNQLPGLVAVDGARVLTLGLLSAAESRELLARRLGSDRIAAEPEAADEIVTGCARLSLALVVVAARAAAHPGFPLAGLAAELRETAGGLDAFDGGDQLLDVRAALSWSYRTMSPAAARVFRLLGLHPGPDVSVTAAASLVDLPVGRVRPLLAEIARAHLIDEHAYGRYAFHDLLRAYAAELTDTEDTPADRAAALRRMFGHYLHTAHPAALVLDAHRDPIDLEPAEPGALVHPVDTYEQAMAWFTAEHNNLVAAVSRAAEAGFDAYAWQLTWTLVSFFDRQGHWHDRLALQQVALAAADRRGDLAGQTVSHRDLARGLSQLGRYDDARAHLRRAFALLGRLGDQVGQAHTHLSMSMIYDLQGRIPDAIRHDLLSLELYRSLGHQSGQANALNNVGWHHALLGDYQEALGYCEKALVLQAEIGHRIAETSTWDSLGYIRHRLGDHAQALACFERAIELSRELGHRFGEAEALDHLGDVRQDLGEPDRARAAWRAALEILTVLGHPAAEAVRAKLPDAPAP